jgi:hypothetical protein
MKKILSLLFFITINSQVAAFTLATSDTQQQGWAAKPLKFNINRAHCPGDIDTLIAASFALWNSVPSSSLVLEMGADSSTTPTQLDGGTATDTPLIVCDPDFSSTLSLDGDLIAGVGIVLGSSYRPITNGGLILNVESGKTAALDSLDGVTKKIVVAHELGHVLGLGHTADESSLMYYSAGSRIALRLSLDDQNGISYLYPRNEFSNRKLIAGCGTISHLTNDDWWNGNSLGLFAIAYFIFRLTVLLSRNKFKPEQLFFAQ